MRQNGVLVGGRILKKFCHFKPFFGLFMRTRIGKNIKPTRIPRLGLQLGDVPDFFAGLETHLAHFSTFWVPRRVASWDVPPHTNSPFTIIIIRIIIITPPMLF